MQESAQVFEPSDLTELRLTQTELSGMYDRAEPTNEV